jgi:hypothetical protein
MRERVQKPAHRDIARSRVRLAEALLANDDAARAVREATTAREMFAAGVGNATDAARADFALARALWPRRSKRADARALAERARNAYLKAGGRFATKAKRVIAWLSTR